MTTCPVHGTKWIVPVDKEQINGRTGEREVVTNSMAGKCAACMSKNKDLGKSKAHPRREKAIVEAESPPPGVSAEEFMKWYSTMMSDPVRRAAFLADTARPSGVNKRVYGVAIRAAAGENMLNADKKCITKALGYKERGLSDRTIKGQVKERLIVKPLSLANAKAGRTSTFWGERLWLIYTLRYSRGYVVVTDTGHESKVFPSIGAIRSAIHKSGWEITR